MLAWVALGLFAGLRPSEAARGVESEEETDRQIARRRSPVAAGGVFPGRPPPATGNRGPTLPAGCTGLGGGEGVATGFAAAYLRLVLARPSRGRREGGLHAREFTRNPAFALPGTGLGGRFGTVLGDSPGRNTKRGKRGLGALVPVEPERAAFAKGPPRRGWSGWRLSAKSVDVSETFAFVNPLRGNPAARLSDTLFEHEKISPVLQSVAPQVPRRAVTRLVYSFIYKVYEEKEEREGKERGERKIQRRWRENRAIE